MNAVILAGGLGTRLSGVVTDVPKPMALINDHPFLEILIANLSLKGITKVILSVGYMHEVIKEYFGDYYNNVEISYVVEDEPLGTGGALKKATNLIGRDEELFVLNGDTFLDLDFMKMKQEYIDSKAEVGIALKSMDDSYRYGRVVLDDENRIAEFKEKGAHEPGLINAGVYILRPSFFEAFDLPARFSLESDCFEKHLDKLNIHPFIVDGYFIDIGIPEDYKRSQSELMPYVVSGL